jgi:hypothetical protein
VSPAISQQAVTTVLHAGKPGAAGLLIRFDQFPLRISDRVCRLLAQIKRRSPVEPADPVLLTISLPPYAHSFTFALIPLTFQLQVIDVYQRLFDLESDIAVTRL